MLNISLGASHPLISSVENSLFSSVPHLLTALFGFMDSNFLISLYILDISTLLDIGLVKTFSPNSQLPFCPIESVLCLTKLFRFRRFHLSIVYLRA